MSTLRLLAVQGRDARPLTPDAELTERRAVKAVIDWLYEHGPTPDEMPREELLARYWAYRREHRDGE